MVKLKQQETNEKKQLITKLQLIQKGKLNDSLKYNVNFYIPLEDKNHNN